MCTAVADTLPEAVYCVPAETAKRARLLSVGSYEVSLDLTRSGEVFGATSVVRFCCACGPGGPPPGSAGAWSQAYPNRRRPCQAGCWPKSKYRVCCMTS
jgi:hypothetical protein